MMTTINNTYTFDGTQTFTKPMVEIYMVTHEFYMAGEINTESQTRVEVTFDQDDNIISIEPPILSEEFVRDMSARYYKEAIHDDTETINAMSVLLEEYKEENKRLTKAIEFYASEKTWIPVWNSSVRYEANVLISPIYDDQGAIARAAIAETQPKPYEVKE